MIQTLDLLGFFLLGAIGGLGHCIGMCTPFVLFVSRHYAADGSRTRAFVAQLWYALGRVLTYMALGAAAGALGGVVQLAGALVGVQRGASIIAGGALVVASLAALVDGAGGFQGGGRWFSQLAGRIGRRAPGHPLLAGMFLGLLPCGLLYSAVIGAVARGGAWQGALALAMFGAGTVPALLALSLVDELLTRQRSLVNRISHVFVLLMGLWFLWTGLFN